MASVQSMMSRLRSSTVICVSRWGEVKECGGGCSKVVVEDSKAGRKMPAPARCTFVDFKIWWMRRVMTFSRIALLRSRRLIVPGAFDD